MRGIKRRGLFEFEEFSIIESVSTPFVNTYVMTPPPLRIGSGQFDTYPHP